MTEQAKVRLSGRNGLLGIVPAMLGFHPTDSVVMVCLGTDNRVGPVVRVNLDDYRQAPTVMADRFAGYLDRHAHRGVLIFYGVDTDPDNFAGMIDVRGGRIVGVEFVDNTPQPIDDKLMAENVGFGKVVVGNRDALRAQVEYDKAGPADLELLAAMADKMSRDLFLIAHRDDVRGMLQRILAACRTIPDDTGDPLVLVNLCATASLLAYRSGDGSLAQICVDRVLRLDPDNQLAMLMIWIMAEGVPPADLDEILADIPNPEEEK